MPPSIEEDSSSIASLSQLKEETTEKFVQETEDVNITYSEEPTTTERNFDLIKRKMMLMQIGMKRRYGHRGLPQEAFGEISGDDLPLMSSKSHRPNVFETREERRRRLLDEER